MATSFFIVINVSHAVDFNFELCYIIFGKILY